MAHQLQNANQSDRKIKVGQKLKPFSRRIREIQEPRSIKLSNHGALFRELASSRATLDQCSRIPYKSEMEEAFVRDFSNVKAYSGRQAKKFTEALGAEAFAVGERIFFAHSHPNKGTVAHELTHVVQQGRKANDQNRMITSRSQRAEREARKVQYEIAAGRSAPKILEALSPAIISPVFSEPVPLHLHRYPEMCVEVQYEPRDQRLRLFVPRVVPLLFEQQAGVPPSIITEDVERAIGLQQPDGLENMVWYELPERWAYRVEYDVRIFSADGWELLDRFFPTPAPTARERQQLLEGLERERLARQAENEPEFLTTEEMEDYASGEFPIFEELPAEEESIISQEPLPAAVTIRNDLWGYGVEMLGTWRSEVREAVRDFRTQGAMHEQHINWLIALAGNMTWATTVFAVTATGVAPGVAAMCLAGAFLGSGGVRLNRESTIQAMFQRLCVSAIDPLKQRIERDHLPHLVDLLAVRAVRTNVSNPQELSGLLWSHMFPAIHYDDRETQVRQNITRNLQTLWPIFESNYNRWDSEINLSCDPSRLSECIRQHPFTAQMAFAGVSLESLLFQQ